METIIKCKNNHAWNEIMSNNNDFDDYFTRSITSKYNCL